MSVFELGVLLKNYDWNEAESILEAELHIPSDLKAFDGHFPAMPILPGIVQIAIIRELIERVLNRPLWMYEITRSRMVQMLLPEDHIRVQVKLHREDTTDDVMLYSASATVSKNGKIATKLQIKVGSQPTEDLVRQEIVDDAEL